MEYFVEQATTHREAEAKVRQKYGDHARIMHHRTVRVGGFLGLFSREGVEVTGYFSNEPRSKTAPTQRAPESREKRSFEDEKQKLLEVMKGDRGLDTVLEELRSIKASLSAGQGGEPEHATFSHVRRILAENDFAPAFTDRIVERMRRELSVDQLDDLDAVLSDILGWIGDSIRIHTPRSTGKPEIFILVGPLMSSAK